MPRRLGYGWFAAIVVAYLAIIKGVGYVAGEIWDVEDGLYTTQDVIVQMWLPIITGTASPSTKAAT